MSRQNRFYSLPSTKPKVNQRQRPRLIKGKFLCLVTGAGNGLGRAIANLAFQDQGILPDAWMGSKLVLIDIDEDALNETAGKKMRQFLAHRKITVDLYTVDLANMSDTEQLMTESITKYDKDFERVILVNAVYTLGDIAKLLNSTDDLPSIQKFWDLNVNSKIWLVNQICKIFEFSAKSIVDVTSSDLNQPTPSLGLACMASSAMKTFDEVFAKENPEIKVLRYATDRLEDRHASRIMDETDNPNLREEIRTQKRDGKLMSCLEASKKMIKALEHKDFKKGDVLHIDGCSE